MGIGSVTSMNPMSGIQMPMTSSTDSKTKSIKNEITDKQQQLRALSSKEELSVNEEMNERKKLQKEISGLNTELKQHQEEFLKSQKREIRMAELRENMKPAKEETSEDKIQTDEKSPDKADETNLPADKLPADQPGTVITKNGDDMVILKGKANQDEKQGIDTEEKPAEETKEEVIAEKEPDSINRDTDAGLSGKETRALVSADISVEQANRQGTVIARIRNGIAILKDTISQDEKQGIDTEKKQAELEKMEKQEQRASTFQFSLLGEANSTMQSAAGTGVSGAQNGTQTNTANNAFINALKSSQQEEQAALQRFQVSFGN